jgi:aminoglycoside N3'-acetyltransferase
MARVHFFNQNMLGKQAAVFFVHCKFFHAPLTLPATRDVIAALSQGVVMIIATPAYRHSRACAGER